MLCTIIPCRVRNWIQLSACALTFLMHHPDLRSEGHVLAEFITHLSSIVKTGAHLNGRDLWVYHKSTRSSKKACIDGLKDARHCGMNPATRYCGDSLHSLDSGAQKINRIAEGCSPGTSAMCPFRSVSIPLHAVTFSLHALPIVASISWPGYNLRRICRPRQALHLAR